MSGRAFLITIDTEGDDCWSRPREVTTRNARYLPRFQALCEAHGFLPTYLVNHEMARDATFVELARDALARGRAEIGMHMHPWDSPPIEPLGPRDWYDQPYATEFPAAAVARKAAYMSALLEDIFARKMTSHRAGRWGFNAAYARALADMGYRVDCSVTPGVSWAAHPGLAGGAGGPDYTAFPERPYRLDLDDISRPGTSALIEVPMTILARPRPLHRELARRLLGRRGPRRVWMRPDGRNLPDLIDLLGAVVDADAPCLQFTLHSSEFMPGGSPNFRDDAAIERLYAHLAELFPRIRQHFSGQTLTDFADHWAAQG